MIAALQAAREALRGLEGVQSCKIGIEPNISPGDWPLIRLAPRRILPGKPYGNRTVEASIIFGCDVSESEGTESVYEALAAMENAIVSAVRTLGGRYLETNFQPPEEEVHPFKFMEVRVELREENVDEA